LRPLQRVALALIASSCIVAMLLAFAVVAVAAAGVVIATPANNATVSGAVTVTAVCDGGGSRTISTVQYRIDSGSWVTMSGPNGSLTGTWTATWTSTGSTNGTHTVTCRETLSNGAQVTSAVTSVRVLNGTITISVPAATTLNVSMDTTAATDVAVKVTSTLPWGMSVQADRDLTSSIDRITPDRFAFTSSTDGTGVTVPIDKSFPVGSAASVISTAGVNTPLGNTVTVHYHLRATHDDAPGTYSAIHTYTVVAN
jgi:hypothetical protein